MGNCSSWARKGGGGRRRRAVPESLAEPLAAGALPAAGATARRGARPLAVRPLAATSATLRRRTAAVELEPALLVLVDQLQLLHQRRQHLALIRRDERDPGAGAPGAAGP